MTWLWGLLAAAGLLWPDHVRSSFDGVPLDRPVEAIVVGVAVPLLWWLDARFLRSATARTLVVLLLAWRAVSALTLVQEGWCVRFTPARPYVLSQRGAPHAWDVRADWRSVDPACSAIVDRPYEQLSDFPAWFFNLPPAFPDTKLDPADRPPHATVGMSVQGFVAPRQAGVLGLDTSEDSRMTMAIDGGPAVESASLSPGVHAIVASGTLTGDRWRFVPTWNGASLWSASSVATTRRPSMWDLFARQWLRWVPTFLVGGFVASWIASLVGRLADPVLTAWSIGASAVVAFIASAESSPLLPCAIAALAAAAFVPFARRNRNTRGVLVAVGIPWLTYIVVRSAPHIGRFTLYDWGDDYWTFQRFAYRIAMQGFWLEGGSATFWQQPLYRWIAAVLHLAFGDSSVGEFYFDGACLLAAAVFVFFVVRSWTSFGWGVAAAAGSLALFTAKLSVFIGRGLSEIASAGFIYLAAVLLLRARAGSVRFVAAGGALAALGFYTRLNNLPMAAGLAVFALPLCVPAGAIVSRRHWFRLLSWRVAAGVAASLALAAILFAWRTWYYTGVFSMFYGTSREHLSVWRAGVPPAANLAHLLDSLAMVLTINDPTRIDVYSVPVLAGAVVGLLALAGAPVFRRVPLALPLFFAASLAGSLVARGSAYSGRFSIHVIPIAVATLARGAAAAFARTGAPAVQQT